MRVLGLALGQHVREADVHFPLQRADEALDLAVAEAEARAQLGADERAQRLARGDEPPPGRGLAHAVDGGELLDAQAVHQAEAQYGAVPRRQSRQRGAHGLPQLFAGAGAEERGLRSRTERANTGGDRVVRSIVGVAAEVERPPHSRRGQPPAQRGTPTVLGDARPLPGEDMRAEILGHEVRERGRRIDPPHSSTNDRDEQRIESLEGRPIGAGARVGELQIGGVRRLVAHRRIVARMSDCARTARMSGRGAGCPAEETIADFVDGRLSQGPLGAVESHIGVCDPCRDLVAELAMLSGSDAPRGLEDGGGRAERRKRGRAGDTGLETPFAETLPAAARGRLLVAGDVMGRYRVLEAIGAGGMGVVYAAYDPALERRIALKVVRPHAADSQSARTRLIHEAKAMARVSHPNVLPIFDAGTEGEQVFIAMELVDGRTLAEWLRERQRSKKEVLRAFLDAAQGLEAAHAKGIVHRDFKPSNVLVSWDGSVRVTDFGLARTAGGETIVAHAAGAPPTPSGELALTQTGAVLGTPGYMAPEQFARKELDARTDQFSFCVALFEALFGRRPWGGRTVDEIAKNVLSGTATAPPRASGVSRTVERAVLRGLSADPAARFPSMRPLIDALSRDPAARRRRVAVAAAVMLSVAAAPVALATRGAPPSPKPCAGAERALAGVWDDGKKAALSAAFLATGKPYATDATRVVEEDLDAYAREWTNAHTEACEATRVQGSQPEDVLTLRMVCLDDRLRYLRSLTDVFLSADEKVVEKAPQAVRSLPRIAACADIAALTARVRPPGDPETAAKVDALRTRLARAAALDQAGRYGDVKELEAPLEVDARAAGYAPLLAQTLHVLASYRLHTSDLEAAEKLEFEAAWAAERARDDELGAQVWTNLVRLVGALRWRMDEGLRLAGEARAKIERLGRPDDALEGELLRFVGILHCYQGRFAECVEETRQAVSLHERAFGADNRGVAPALTALCRGLDGVGRSEEAVPVCQRALDLLERALGPEHPALIDALSLLGNVTENVSGADDAVKLQLRTLHLVEATFGAEHPRVATALNNLAYAQMLAGKHAEALVTGERGLAMGIKLIGVDKPEVAGTYDTVAHALLGLGRTSEAVDDFARAAALWEKNVGPKNPLVADSLTGLGIALTAAGRPKEAVPHLERALAIRQGASVAQQKVAETQDALTRARSAAAAASR